MKILASLAVALLALVSSASAASADYDATWRYYADYSAHYQVRTDGTTDVTVDFTLDFNGYQGHGPLLTFPSTQPYDETYERVFSISDVRSSSPTGAPAQYSLYREGDVIVIRIGDPDIGDVDGPQQYHLEYTVDGLLNSTTVAEAGLGTTDEVAWDEFYINVFGNGWDHEFHNVTVSVGGDVGAFGDTLCFAGPQYDTQPCTSQSLSDGVATFSQEYLAPHNPLSVAVQFPPGSFDTALHLRDRNEVARALNIGPWTVGGGAAILIGGIVLIFRRINGVAADVQYAGVTPGQTPHLLDDGSVATEARDKSAPVAVQYEPPPGLRPGQLGTLIDEVADPRDVTATIVDLAVRGYLRIDQTGETGTFKKTPDYTLVKLREADGAMVEYEEELFDSLFLSRQEVPLSALKSTFSTSMAAVQAKMYINVTKLGWFRSNPKSARTSWLQSGILLATVGGFVTIAAGSVGLSLVTAPISILGLVIAFTSRNAPARKAEGTRVLAQTRGFEQYLAMADANQLRWEEGRDVFSRYLPYAIAFGVADKWAGKFEELAKQGKVSPAPTWYGGAIAGGNFWQDHQGFGEQMNSFAAIADTALSTPTPGSSGGSGFSSSGGGGGFSGGGSFGGGGGSW